MPRMVERERTLQWIVARAAVSAARAAAWRRQWRSMCGMVSTTGNAGVEHWRQWGLVAAATAFLAKRCWASPVRERPRARRERVCCWATESVEWVVRKEGMTGLGMHWVRGAVVRWRAGAAGPCGLGY